MPFQVGDRVQLQQAYRDITSEEGTVYYIDERDERRSAEDRFLQLLVVFDKPFPNGHDGNGTHGIHVRSKPRSCWWVLTGMIECAPPCEVVATGSTEIDICS
jgi:hypothetical protein